MHAPDRTWDPVRFGRGTRGFAAFVTLINGLVVLGFGAVVVPSSGVGSPLIAWLAIVGIAAGLAHLVAVCGLIRGRRWSGSLVGYLAAGGIGASVFAILLITRAGEPILGAADASAVGFFIWMIGAWLVATRFALKPFRPIEGTRAVLAAAPDREQSFRDIERLGWQRRSPPHDPEPCVVGHRHHEECGSIAFRAADKPARRPSIDRSQMKNRSACACGH